MSDYLKERDDKYHTYELTKEAKDEVKRIETSDSWEQVKTTFSGFIMFESNSDSYFEASIGPRENGEIQIIVLREKENEEYETIRKYKGNFEDCLSKIKEWLQKEPKELS